MIVSNYQLLEKIADGPQAAVFRSFNKSNPDRLPVLKILKAGVMSDAKKSQFRRKIEHLKVLDDPCVITPLHSVNGMELVSSRRIISMGSAP